MAVLENQTLEMENVVSFRAKMNKNDLAFRAKEIDRLLENNDAHKNGPSVTATFSVEQSAYGPLMDIELLVPIDKKIDVPDGYKFKERFYLTNALKIKHVGDLSKMQNTARELNEFISSNKLVPISTGYNVTLNEPKSPIETAEVDIYISVSPNRL